MDRFIRALLIRIPAIRRQLVRLNNLEIEIQQQSAHGPQLKNIESIVQHHGVTFGTQLANLETQQAQAAGRLVDLETAIQGNQKLIKQAIAERESSRRKLDADLGARLSDFEASMHQQHESTSSRLANLESTMSQVHELNAGVQDRLAAHDDATQSQGLRLGSVESTLAQIHELNAGVQTRLATLDAATQEQQGCIGTLTELMSQRDRQASQRLSEKVSKLERKNRLLSVGHGATFEELISRGKLLTASSYHFEELLALRTSQASSAASVPPLVFIHVPKAGGTTLNSIFMKNYRYRIDSYGEDFFPRYFPDEFVSLVQKPLPDDTRRPVFFTGHINIANTIFRYMPVRYVTVTMLRDPVSRVVSHYRFHSTISRSPLSAAIRSDNLGLLEYFKRFRSTIPLQYEIFAPRVSSNESESILVQDALRNLEDRVSVFGFQEHFAEAVSLFANLLGLPNVLYKSLNKTPNDAAATSRDEVEELRKQLVHDIKFYEGAAELYRGRKNALSSDLHTRCTTVPETQHDWSVPEGHPWSRFYS